MQRILRARRVLSARRGSSWPVVVETEAGPFLTKLRGAAQGTGPLVAETVVGGLAEALGLPVPRRERIAIEPGIPSDDPHQELRDLLDRSAGVSLGFELIEGSRELRASEAEALPDDFACGVLWLDALVQNPDRTRRNPNLLIRRGRHWLIDHGAALPFQYDWSRVSEAAPRSGAYPLSRHLFASRAPALARRDAALAAQVTRAVLRGAVDQVPDEFLAPLVERPLAARLERRRRAYEAFLWKRLKAPRPFVPAAA